MDEIEKLTPIQYEITRELYKAIERLGGDMELLGAVGSWGDTLPQADVLEMLKVCNGN